MARTMDEGNDGGFELLPTGETLVTLKHIKDKETSTGKMQWMWCFECDELMRENGDPAMLFERTFTNFNHISGMFDPEDRWFKERVDEAKAAGEKYDVDQMIGEQFIANVGTREWNGKTFNTILSLRPAGEDFGDPFAEADKEAVAAGGDPFKGN